MVLKTTTISACMYRLQMRSNIGGTQPTGVRNHFLGLQNDTLETAFKKTLHSPILLKLGSY